MSTRRQDRKAVRKANRVSAIDQEKPKRTIRKIVIICVAILFFISEVFIVSIAKNRYDYGRSVKVAEEMSIQLSLLNSSLQAGNKAQFDESLQAFREQLDLFEKNNYVRKNASELLEKLTNYSSLFTNDVVLVTQIMEIKVATNMIAATALDAQNSKVDAVKIYAIRDDYTALRNGLETISAPELTEIKDKLFSLSDEMVKYTDSAAVCISVCSENILNEKQNIIKDIIARYETDLAKLSQAQSEKYNPNFLILDLGEYCEL